MSQLEGAGMKNQQVGLLEVGHLMCLVLRAYLVFSNWSRVGSRGKNREAGCH